MSGVHDIYKAAAPGSQRTHNVVVNFIAGAVITVGILALGSWVLDIEAGQRLLLGFQSMKFNTALCLIACGFVLWRSAPAAASASDPIVAFLALFIIVISGLTLFEYGSGWSLGIDNLVVFRHGHGSGELARADVCGHGVVSQHDWRRAVDQYDSDASFHTGIAAFRTSGDHCQRCSADRLCVWRYGIQAVYFLDHGAA